MASVTKRNGSWRVQIRRKGYPKVFGSFSSERKAWQWAREQESKMDKGEWVDNNEARRTTLAEAIDRYLETETPKKAPTTARNERRKGEFLKGRNIAQRFLTGIRGPDIAEYRDTREEEAAPDTVRLDLALISQVYRKAATEWRGYEGIPNPVQAIRRPQGNRRNRRFKPGEEERLLKYAQRDRQGEDLYPILLIAIDAGLRKGEIARIRKEEFNPATGKLLVPGEDPGASKSEPRTVPLSQRVLEALGQRLQGGGPLWDMDYGQLDDAWQRIRIDAGAPDLRFHDIRHEAISRMFESGMSLMQVAGISGHQSLQMLKRYTHLSPNPEAV